MRSLSLSVPLFAVFALCLWGAIPLPAQTAPEAAAAAGATATEEEEGKIKGLEIKRPGGGYIGLRTEGVVLRATFYDEKKKPVAADAVRISARWRDGKPRFAVLLPSAPETLSSPGVFSRPFNYLVYLTLVGPDDQVIESHSLRLMGSDE